MKAERRRMKRNKPLPVHPSPFILQPFHPGPSPQPSPPSTGERGQERRPAPKVSGGQVLRGEGEGEGLFLFLLAPHPSARAREREPAAGRIRSRAKPAIRHFGPLMSGRPTPPAAGR